MEPGDTVILTVGAYWSKRSSRRAYLDKGTRLTVVRPSTAHSVKFICRAPDGTEFSIDKRNLEPAQEAKA